MLRLKWFLLAIGIGSAMFLLKGKYGYLLQSQRNQPPDSQLTESGPLSLTKAESDPELDFLKMPDGFQIQYFAREVPGARSLAVGENGAVYVGSRSQGVVYALIDQDEDNRADSRHLIAEGLNQPNGVAYHDGDLYVAEIHRILVYRGIGSTYSSKPQPEVVFDKLPRDTHHGWRYLKIGPDRKLYLGLGAPCNVCRTDDPFASIARLNLDGSGFEIIARGIRNTVGLTWSPADRSLWFTDNGRDLLGDNVPPDELNRLASESDHFGFPVCHGQGILDPQFGRGQSCLNYVSPRLELGPHVAALGLLFYQGKQFPQEYQGRLLIAEHGSWNRSEPIGYRLMQVAIDGDRASDYREFITGWLEDTRDARGRPVDLAELPDGSVLISDDFAGAVYRLTYNVR